MAQTHSCVTRGHFAQMAVVAKHIAIVRVLRLTFATLRTAEFGPSLGCRNNPNFCDAYDL